MREDFRAIRPDYTRTLYGYEVFSYNQWLAKLMDLHTHYPSVSWNKYVPADPSPFPSISLFPRNWFAKPIKSWP